MMPSPMICREPHAYSRAAPGREQDQRADAAAEQRGAEVVDAVPRVRRVQVEARARRSRTATMPTGTLT